MEDLWNEMFSFTRTVKRKAPVGKLIHIADFSYGSAYGEIIAKNCHGKWVVEKPILEMTERGEEWCGDFTHHEFKTLKAAKKFCTDHGATLSTERE